MTVVSTTTLHSIPLKPAKPLTAAREPTSKTPSLVDEFLAHHGELNTMKDQPVVVDGKNLSVAGIASVARSLRSAALSSEPEVRERVEVSRQLMQSNIDEGNSIYGVSTGYGGSADTRTRDHEALGLSLLQHQHIGIISASSPHAFASTVMPKEWVRAAILIRANSLVRGHSGIRWQLIERMMDLLRAGVTPLVPLRGSISASGDLSPLSYVAGALLGEPTVLCDIKQNANAPNTYSPAPEALSLNGISPVRLTDKEHLGLLNGTAFSAGLASLVYSDALKLSLLAQVCTAMATEALLGTAASFHPFIHDECRPHSGQIEVARNLRHLLDGSRLAAPASESARSLEEENDPHMLRQDRYALRTAPQWLGPPLEALLTGLRAVRVEANSTTDNPLLDPVGKNVHHGGNFQAEALALPLAALPTSLFALGKLLFAQQTEMLNAQLNRGLPPNLAGWEPSTDYGGKGIDIATAAYTAELAGLAAAATGTATGVQSAEMHNQSVNSMALVIARRANEAVDVLTMLIASFLYTLTQGVDLRSLQNDFFHDVREILRHALPSVVPDFTPILLHELCTTFRAAFEEHTTMDSTDQCAKAASALSTTLLSSPALPSTTPAPALNAFTSTVARSAAESLRKFRTEYLLASKEGKTLRTAQLLGAGTVKVYHFVRDTLKIPMHGVENMQRFLGGLGSRDHGRQAHGECITMIYEALRDGRASDMLADVFADVGLDL